ncbi:MULTISPECIES: LuxR C-terminal-related transcriptional regulator [unclassified Streptomyces]|uniref:helix-turn-helix transcriptional regulator n=1 Tax=unclassified Streptomyces TaxID=2593676 RepID=UPI001FFD7AB4|nr:MULTISPECIES: LuxR C-terminal-related transcriptional regulator [unclassified Streptomyces]
MPSPDRSRTRSHSPGGPVPFPRSPLRPDDADAFRHALRLARQRTGVRTVFGGEVADGALRLTEFTGTLTDSMRGLRVVPGRGLGGYVLAHQRPYAVNDYVPATTITHDYDSPVRREGIRAIVAAPVTVQGGVRGVLYAATRDTTPLGDRATAALMDAARRLAGEIAVRQEVDRRVRLLETAVEAPPAQPPAPGLDALRDLHAELRGIAQQIEDTKLRDRLRHACDRFLRAGIEGDGGDTGPQGGDSGAGPHADRTEDRPRLSPRELDVLSYVALGCTNAEAAQYLGLEPETVKAYLRSATRKLGVHSRHHAVAAARRHGLLP